MTVSTTPDSTRRVSLVPMAEEHFGDVMELERRTYATPWSEKIFRDELAAENRIYLVALDAEGCVVGYGGLMGVGEEAHITTVAVDPGHRRARIGTRLILELVTGAIDRGAKSLTLEVRVSNASAQALYRRFGMVPVGVRKAYYVDEDALIMWAHEIDSPSYAERLRQIREDLP